MPEQGGGRMRETAGVFHDKNPGVPAAVVSNSPVSGNIIPFTQNLVAERVMKLKDIGEHLALRSVSLHKNHKIDIRLNPPELGRVRVAVALEEGGVKVHFTVENPHIQQVLETKLMDLRQNLVAQGLSVGDLGVGTYGSQDTEQGMPFFTFHNAEDVSYGVSTEESDSESVPGLAHPAPGLVNYLI